MPEPITTATGGATFVISKGLSALSGLVGGLSIAALWQPQKLRRHGALAAGAIIGGMSVGGAVALGGMLAKWLGLDYADLDTVLGIGFLVGACSVGLISFLANFFDNHEGDDILEVVNEVKARPSAPKKPARRKSTPRKQGAKQ
jgi:hypothetical protein